MRTLTPTLHGSKSVVWMQTRMFFPLQISEHLVMVLLLCRKEMPCVGGSLRQGFFDYRAWWAPDALAFFGVQLGKLATEYDESVARAGNKIAITTARWVVGFVGLKVVEVTAARAPMVGLGVMEVTV